MAGAAPTSFDFGRAFGQAFGIVFRNWALLLALSAAVSFAGLVVTILMALANAGLAAGAGGQASPFVLLSALVQLLIFAFQLGFLFAVVSYLGAHPELEGGFGRRFMACARVGVHKAPGVLAILLLREIPVFVGSMFFVIPGVFLSLLWFVNVPAYVNENTGVFGAFTRSAALTQGSRLVIFGLSLLVGLIAFIAFYAAFLLLALPFLALDRSHATDMTPAALAMASVAVVAVYAGVTLFLSMLAALPASVYRELTRIKGGGPPELAQVFA